MLKGLKRSAESLVSSVYASVALEVLFLDLNQMDEAAWEKKQDSFTIKRLKPSDHDAIKKAFAPNIADPLVHGRENSWAYLIFDGDDLVGYCWVGEGLVRNQGRYPLQYDLPVKKGYLVYYDGYVLPKARGRGAIKSFGRQFSKIARDEGYNGIFTLFKTSNSSMRSAAIKIGNYQIVGRIKLKKVLSKVEKDLSGLDFVCDSK